MGVCAWRCPQLSPRLRHKCLESLSVVPQITKNAIHFVSKLPQLCASQVIRIRTLKITAGGLLITNADPSLLKKKASFRAICTQYKRARATLNFVTKYDFQILRDDLNCRHCVTAVFLRTLSPIRRFPNSTLYRLCYPTCNGQTPAGPDGLCQRRPKSSGVERG